MITDLINWMIMQVQLIILRIEMRALVEKLRFYDITPTEYNLKVEKINANIKLLKTKK